ADLREGGGGGDDERGAGRVDVEPPGGGTGGGEGFPDAVAGGDGSVPVVTDGFEDVALLGPEVLAEAGMDPADGVAGVGGGAGVEEVGGDRPGGGDHVSLLGRSWWPVRAAGACLCRRGCCRGASR